MCICRSIVQRPPSGQRVIFGELVWFLMRDVPILPPILPFLNHILFSLLPQIHSKWRAECAWGETLSKLNEWGPCYLLWNCYLIKRGFCHTAASAPVTQSSYHNRFLSRSQFPCSHADPLFFCRCLSPLVKGLLTGRILNSSVWRIKCCWFCAKENNR